jgi:hypothetical protein
METFEIKCFKPILNFSYVLAVSMKVANNRGSCVIIKVESEVLDVDYKGWELRG